MYELNVVLVWGEPKLKEFKSMPASVTRRWRAKLVYIGFFGATQVFLVRYFAAKTKQEMVMPASSFGDSFQSPMLRMVPLRRPVCWAVKLANCMWNKMSSHKCNILPLKLLNLFRITSYAAGFCT